MPTLMLCLKEFKGLFLSKAAAGLGVVLQDEIHEGLTYDHTHLDRLAGVIPNLAATALENSHIRWPLEHQIPSHRVRDDLLQVLKGNFFINSDDSLGLLLGEYLAVIAVGPPLLSPGSQSREDIVDEQVKIFLDPAAIDICVQTAKVEESP